MNLRSLHFTKKSQKGTKTKKLFLRRSLKILRRTVPKKCKDFLFYHQYRRFQLLNDWYDLVLNVMIWGWGMPASLWYFSGSVLAFFNGVDLPEQTLPYFNDTLQAAIFLIMQHFLSAAMNKGFEIFEIFDLNERHAMNNMTLGLYFMDNLKSTLLLIVLGLPAFWLFMWLIEVGGSLFPILILIFTVGVLVVYKYLYTNFIVFWFNDFQELPDDIPGLLNLRQEIHDMAAKKGFPVQHIYKVDASKRTGHSNAAVIGFGKSQKIIIYDTLLARHEEEDSSKINLEEKDEKTTSQVQPSTPGRSIAQQTHKALHQGLNFEKDEIKAIVAHELGHWHNNDQYKIMLFLTVEFAFVFYIFSLVINNMTILKSFGFTEKSNFASLVIFMKFYEVLIFITGKLQTAFIRNLEFKAD